MHNLDLERVIQEIKDRNASVVLLQLPDGLRNTAFSLTQTLNEITGAEIIISGDSCYGACDLALTQAETVKADLIIHYGHSPMIESEIPVLYVEAAYDFNAVALAEKAFPLVRDWKGVGLTTTIQHIHLLQEIAAVLQNKGIRTNIGKGKPIHPGQILGCDYTAVRAIAENVQGFLYIGAGRFHPTGLAATIGKPIVIANPYTMETGLLPEKVVTRLAMKRMAAINNAKSAEKWSILVSTKPGQKNIAQAKHLKKILYDNGRKAAIILLDEINPQTLTNFSEAQAFVNTACPRIALDNHSDSMRPILTPKETLIALKQRLWETTWGQGYLEDN
jgi:2-(3-amino-3-carboxypropyl)histidine synthase